MDASRLLTSLLGGVIDARPKRHDKVARFLGGSSGSLWNAKTLMTAGALGWAAYEIYRSKSGAGGATTSFPGQPVVAGTVVVPSTVPSTASPTSSAVPPPLPGFASVPPLPGGPPIEPVRRLVGVLLAAARSDGELGEAEYGRILASAREAGGTALVGEELRNPTPLERLAGGIPEPLARADLYRMAFSVVRCDEGVNAKERAWLASLARALDLDTNATVALEREVAVGITSA